MRPSNIFPVLCLLLPVFGAGCADDAPGPPPGECELTSECETPLVCRMERCRRECTTSEDCGLELLCVRADDGLEVCQLPEETRCSLDSECPRPLVCRSGSCLNDCADDRDCPAGQRCDLEETASCVGDR